MIFGRGLNFETFFCNSSLITSQILFHIKETEVRMTNEVEKLQAGEIIDGKKYLMAEPTNVCDSTDS